MPRRWKRWHWYSRGYAEILATLEALGTDPESHLFALDSAGIRGGSSAGQESACQEEYAEALSLILQTRTVEARDRLRSCLAEDRTNADLQYQLARTHIVDFNQSRTAGEGRESLEQAVRELDRALAIDPEHLNALRLKYPIHRGKGSIDYDPEDAYKLARKALALQPSSHPFLVNVAAGERRRVDGTERGPVLRRKRRPGSARFHDRARPGRLPPEANAR